MVFDIMNIKYMNTRPMDRSQRGGTGPSAYGTSPTVINNLGPVPNYIFIKNFEDCISNMDFRSKYT